jgi:preprotein translocase subunit YajC
MTSIFLAAQAAQGSGMSMILVMVAIFAIMWFFMIRPQQKKQKEIQIFQNSITEGTQVITAGGIYGTVKHIDSATNNIELEIARGVVIKINRNSVFQNPESMPLAK